MNVKQTRDIIVTMQDINLLFDFFLTPMGIVMIGIISVIGFALLQLFVVDLYGDVKNRLNRSKSGIKIETGDCMHTDYAGVIEHWIHFEITNGTKQTLRIDDIAVYDKRKRKMSFFSRGYVSTETKIEIPPDYTMPKSYFCKREPTGETDIVKLKMKIDIRGKGTRSLKIESMGVSKEKLPIGELLSL